MVLDVLGHIVVDRRGQCQVEETICPTCPRQRQDVRIEFGEGIPVIIFPAYIRVPAEEGRQSICVCVCGLSQKEQAV